MKASTKVLCALVLVAGVAAASADQTSQKDSKTSAKAKAKAVEKSSSGKAVKQEYQPQTGYKAPRKVHLDGRITDGPYQLVVISQDTIRNGGYSTLSQVLSRNGLRR